MGADSSRPNILFIMPDQMRGDCLSLEGHPVMTTPVIDSIGGAGVHFRRAYTTCASCIPARRALLTGLHPATTGVVGYEDGVPIGTATLPELLREGGYRTVLAGRHMHQYPYNRPYGFDERVLGSTYITDDQYAAFLAAEAPALGGIRGIGLSHNGAHARSWPLAEHLHPTNWVVARAREALAAHEAIASSGTTPSGANPPGGAGPLFLCASFFAPHPPLFPPAHHFDSIHRRELPPAAIGSWETPPRSAGMGVDAHRTILQGEALRQVQSGYYGLIEHLDSQLYWLLHEFEQASRRAEREWMVVFTTDHGELLGDHYLFRKCEPYEGSSRIPFLISGSRGLGFAGGRVSDVPVCLEDLMPTLLDAAGLPVPGDLDGRSLVPILRGTGSIDREYVHGEHAPCYDDEQAYHALFGPRMKYVWRPATGTEELFDLAADPDELVNLAAVQPDVTAAWRRRLVERLAGRPEGFVHDGTLVPGRPYPSVLPFARGASSTRT